MLKDQNPLLAETQPRAGLLESQKPSFGFFSFRENGGADRDRTDDILLAKQALSQLSYSPIAPSITEVLKVVGLDRFELSTSPLSGVRSSQLSYRPGIADQLCADWRAYSVAPPIHPEGWRRGLLSSLEGFRGHS